MRLDISVENRIIRIKITGYNPNYFSDNPYSGLFFIPYPIPYPVSISESDILIRWIPSYRLWIPQNGFGIGFGVEIIISVYTPSHCTHYRLQVC